MTSLATPAFSTAQPGAFTQLRRCLAADMLKLRRTPALWLALCGGALPVLLNFLVFYFKGEKLLQPGANPWPPYVITNWKIASILLLPLFVTLLCSLVLALEHRAAGWKHLLVQPVGYGAAYGSKLLVLLGLNGLAHGMYLLVLLASGVLLGWLKPALGFQTGPLAVPPLLLMLGHTFVATLGILGVQYAAALALRSFVGPVSLGIAGLISGLTLMGWEYLHLIPYAAPMGALAAFPAGGRGALIIKSALTTGEWWSLGWFGAALMVGYVLFRRRPAAS